MGDNVGVTGFAYLWLFLGQTRFVNASSLLPQAAIVVNHSNKSWSLLPGGNVTRSGAILQQQWREIMRVFRGTFVRTIFAI